MLYVYVGSWVINFVITYMLMKAKETYECYGELAFKVNFPLIFFILADKYHLNIFHIYKTLLAKYFFFYFVTFISYF